MARSRRPALTRRRQPGTAIVAALPVVVGALVALIVAGVLASLPEGRLEGLVEASGLPRLMPPVAPPFGSTARALLALAAGGMIGAVTWAGLFLLVGPGGVFAPRQRGETGVPVVRRADAHPDAPPRRPLSAADLGTPPAPPQDMAPAPAGPEQDRALPADLEQPLAAFDPQAIPDVPREPVRAVRSVAPLPTSMLRGFPSGPAPAAAPPSIEALIDRLECCTRRSGMS